MNNLTKTLDRTCLNMVRVQKRNYKIWITKNETLPWKFADINAGGSHLADYLTGGQLIEAFNELHSFRD